MPSALTYPGVYVEEIPSGVRTINGVATSITAFVGRTERGPIDTATTITNFGDFERTVGGLTDDAPVAFAVRDFYLNGGAQAVVVRVYKTDDPKPAEAAKNGGLTLSASSPGGWAAALQYKCDTENPKQEGKLFNLSVYRKNPADANNPTLLERITTLSVDPTARRAADRVLAAESLYVRGKLDDPTGAIPNATLTDFSATAGAANDPLANDNRYLQSRADKKGLYALEQTDLFNLLCIPPDTFTNDTSQKVYEDAAKYCEDRRAMLLVDSPAEWNDAGKFVSKLKANPRDERNKATPSSKNAALFFPRVVQPNPTKGNQDTIFAPCGILAGIFARTDVTRGVWKAPAGQEATIRGIRKLAVTLTDAENGLLNPVGINCLRSFAASGNVVWGARTLKGDDQLADEYKYVPVRRLALFIEESLYRGTQWAVFEPNDEPLWAQLRLNIGSFMHDLFRQGAFQGQTPQQAYLVKCDKETTTQSDINRGIVNVLVGFAPLKPAEFVILKIQQLAGQIET